MTLAVIVACEDSFYMITDTRTLDVDDWSFTDNTKKIFYSKRHMLGLCIAGEAMLPASSDPTNSQKTLSVSYVLEEFFKEIEKKDEDSVRSKISAIENFSILIQEYIKEKHGEEYVVPFQHNVSFFLGCFVNNETVIASYHGESGQKTWDTFNYATDFNSKLCAFSNYQSLIKDYSIKVIDDPKCPIKEGSQVEKANTLLSASNGEYRQAFLDLVVLSTRRDVLTLCLNSIGEYFEYIKLDKDSTAHRYAYFQTKEHSLKRMADTPFPSYILIKTKEDFENAIGEGRIIRHESISPNSINFP